MNQTHTDHITKNKKLLHARAEIIRGIREFFWNADFLEVETPLLLGVPSQEPYLSPMKLALLDERGTAHDAYLHTSPEYTMKKMLAAGFGNIFSICKTFRNRESFGGTHNPEFTMIEWYRVGATMFELMNDVERLVEVLQRKIGKMENGKWKLASREVLSTQENNFKFQISTFKHISMKEVWQETIDVNLDNFLDQPSMLQLCKERGYTIADEETYENLLYTIFLNEIEPTLLTPNSKIIIHHYPAPMAALAKLSDKHTGYAERFEVYVNGMEIANAFTELTDADEQLKRLQEEQALRKKLSKDVYNIDMDFINAVGKMPECAGIALGVDRLVQVLLGVEDIDDVLALPMSKMF